jgi:glycosyltransferase involved in cell wall biosynthesis
MLAACIRRGRHADIAHVDVYSGNGFLWAELSCGALRLAGCPYVLTLHGGNLPVFAQRWPGRVRRLFASAAAVTAPSGFLRDAMRPYRDEIILIPNAIDLPLYPYRPREAAAPKLVWIRAFQRMYNPAMAVRVVAALRPRYPGITLHMVGPDKDGSLAETNAAAEALNVADCVTFVPGVAKREVPAYLGRADVFLNTTNIDNMPISVLEAMASGLCVVSTDAGGVPHIVGHNESGLLVPTGDVDSMATAVARVLDEPRLAARLSARARESSLQYDWARVLGQWQDLFASVQRRRHG